jgi:ankyrin repeat protein
MKSWRQKKTTDLENRFILAAKYGNLQQVKEYWRQNASVNAPGTDGWTALHWACRKGHGNVVQWLVQSGCADVDAPGRDGETALHCACQQGHKDIVKYLVDDCGANTKAKAADGRTPFDVAWQERKTDIVQLLSNLPKAQPLSQSKISSAAVPCAKLEQRLIEAAKNGHLDRLKECCRRNVNVNAQGSDKWTALHWASRNGHLPVVRFLVHGGQANVELKTSRGWTALHWASTTGQLAVVRILVLECGADTAAKTNSGSTPLHLAQQNGQPEVVTFLSNLPVRRPVAERVTDEAADAKLEQRFLDAAKNGYLDHVTNCWLQNVNVHAQGSDGWMALHLASFQGHLNVVQWLILHGHVDVEVTTNSGWTALHCACQSGQVEVVKFLVHAGGANANAKSVDGKTPFDMAWQKRHFDIVKLLSDLPYDRPTSDADGSLDVPCTNLEQRFLDAAQNGHLDQLTECCRLQVNVHACTSNGWTALHWASGNGHFGTVQWLVQSCQMDVDTQGLDGETALHCACQSGQLDVVKYLIEDCGANTAAMAADGRTPFDVAWNERKNNVVEYLSDVPKRSQVSTGSYSSKADSSTYSTVPESLTSSENSADDRARYEEELVHGRMELERMLDDPTAEPTDWSIRYLEDCTDHFNSKVLGEGAFGKVYFGCDKVLGFQFAVKQVPLSVPDEDAFNEIILSFKREISVRFCAFVFHFRRVLPHHDFCSGTETVPSSQYRGFVRISHRNARKKSMFGV